MSLVHTCELCRVDPFDYLTEILSHARELKDAPSDWMPWNYRKAVERDGESPAAPG